MPQKWRNMELVQIDIADAEKIASMAADFRVQLNSFKGIRSTPDEEAAKEEIMGFLEAGFPVYAVRDGGVFAGYLFDSRCAGRRFSTSKLSGRDGALRWRFAYGGVGAL
jgi:hypothetical protein